MAPAYEKYTEEDDSSSENLLEENNHPSTRWSSIRVPWTNKTIDLELGNDSSLHKRLLQSPGLNVFCKAGIICLALWGIFSMGFQLTSFVKTHSPPSCDCGATIAEALTLGCKYDTMAAAWLPAACRDDELSAEFDRAGPGPNGRWSYWADPHRKREMSIPELASLADTRRPFFTNWEWHVAHCTYYWRKQARGKAYLDSSDFYGHIEHCEMVILSDRTQTIMSGIGLNKTSFS